MLQRRAAGADVEQVPPIVHDVLRSPGQPLDAATRAFMEPRFGRDFSGVRVHTDARAAESARAINAHAYTVGNNVVFGTGKHQPHSEAGRRLMAHELTHVVQQGGEHTNPGGELTVSSNSQYEAHADAVEGQTDRFRVFSIKESINRELRRKPKKTAPKVGTTYKHPSGASSPFRTIKATFDGCVFTLFGDGQSLSAVPAESGRPVSVRATDARDCGGSTQESYKNNKKYVGIQDFGPIPEGTYSFSSSKIAVFSSNDQLRFTPGGEFRDPFGKSMHGGDWGAGRSELTPNEIRRGPKGCGDTTKRSGFFLHGGSLSGSSGCIDLGNDGFNSMLTSIAGYSGAIEIAVKYTCESSKVGYFERALGGFTYPETKQPTIMDRLRGAWQQMTE